MCVNGGLGGGLKRKLSLQYNIIIVKIKNKDRLTNKKYNYYKKKYYQGRKISCNTS